VTLLADLVADAGPGAVELGVFGTTDPSEIATIMASLTFEAVGADVTEGLWYRSSVAAVAGLHGSERTRAHSRNQSRTSVRSSRGRRRAALAPRLMGRPSPASPLTANHLEHDRCLRHES
jgi:hypothetical protein